MSGTRILLVEDDDVLRDLVERNLLARSYDVSIATDAESALAQLRTTTFDLIFLDINLPDQTGWDILRIAQREGSLHPQDINGDLNKLPVVVLLYASVRDAWQSSIPSPTYPNPFPWKH